MTIQDRRFLTIQTIASASQWLDVFLIFCVPAFAWNATPAQIATIAAVFGLPMLLLGPVVGVFLDRSDARNTMVAGALTRTLLSGLIAFTTHFEAFVALVLAKGIADVVYGPASSAVANAVVAKERRLAFHSNQGALEKLGKVLIPLAAGLLGSLLGLQQLFLLGAFGTLACAVLVVRMRVEMPPRVRPRRTFAGSMHDLLAGIRSMPSLPGDLKIGVAFSIGLSFMLAVYDPHLAAFLNALGFDASAYSLVVSATAIGAICASAIVKVTWRVVTPVALIRAGIACFCVAVFLATYLAAVEPTLISPEILLLTWLLNGLGYELFVTGSTVNLQNICPLRILGPVSTAQRTLQMGVAVCGPVIGAWLISAYGRQAPFVLGAAMGVVAIVCVGAWRLVEARKRVTSA